MLQRVARPLARYLVTPGMSTMAKTPLPSALPIEVCSCTVANKYVTDRHKVSGPGNGPCNSNSICWR